MSDERTTGDSEQIPDRDAHPHLDREPVRVGCAVPLVSLGAILALMASYLEFVVIHAATSRRNPGAECQPVGPSTTLGGVAVLGICALIAAVLILRSPVRAATWWRLAAIALVLGVVPFLIGLTSSDRCPLLE
jgi:hypothetical protein